MKTGIIIEEIFNVVSHGLGLVLVIIGSCFLLIPVIKDHSINEIIVFSIFCLTLFLTYTASTFYHSLIFTRAKKVFLIFDQSAIFLLIAGTYTPIAVILLHGWMSWTILVFIWFLSILGIVLKSIFADKFRIAIVILYLLMGWVMVIFIRPLLVNMTSMEILLLVAGGLFYSSGVIFYVWNKLPFNHTIWHLFVIAGSASHFLLMFLIR